MIDSISISNGTATIIWDAVMGHNYRLQYTEDLTDTNWIDVSPDVPANGSTAVQFDIIGTSPQRFYRILLVQ